MNPEGREYNIYYEGGGELPSVLSGAYTSKRAARVAIDTYKNSKITKGKVNVASKKAGGTK